MRLITRGRFSINAMIDLALRERQSPVPLSELALRHGISLSYLEQVFAKLRQQLSQIKLRLNKLTLL